MIQWALQVVPVVKNLPANAGDIRDVGSIPGSGRSPGGGHGNLFQYSCLKNYTDWVTWWSTVHVVSKSQIGLKRFRMHAPWSEGQSWNYKYQKHRWFPKQKNIYITLYLNLHIKILKQVIPSPHLAKLDFIINAAILPTDKNSPWVLSLCIPTLYKWEWTEGEVLARLLLPAT